MKFQDIAWLSFRGLSEKKVRTALTVIMVMIGVGSIVALLSLTAGIGASISKSIQSLGPTSIILTSTKSTGFTLADTAGLATLPNVSTVIPLIESSATVKAGTENTSATIIGVDPEGLQELLGGSINLYQGTNYTAGISPSSLVGYDLAFPSSSGNRQTISAGTPVTLSIGAGRSSTTYTVPIVGVLDKYGSSLISPDIDMVMSLSAAETLLHRQSFNMILVKANSTGSVSALSTEITNIYGNNARVLNTQSLASTASSIIGSISALFIVIAGISLLVACIGIMNIMLMSVIERTHEIGIMKSVGFKSKDVLTVFLVQAMMIGIIGGIAGLLIGAGAAFGLSYAISSASSNSSTAASSSTPGAVTAGGARPGGGAVFVAGGAGGGSSFRGSSSSTASSSSSSSGISVTPVFDISLILESLFVAVLVSALAGLYPAWRAARMEPIDALRQL